MQQELDFSLVKKAGIGVTHFARFCGVSRVSANLYLTNKVQPRGLYRKHVAQVLALIERALDKGLLPLPRMPRSDRYKALVEALRAVK